MSFAHTGALVPLPLVSRPPKLTTKPMRWIHAQRIQRRTAAARYPSGQAIVGLALGLRSIELGRMCRSLALDRSLNAAEVAGPPAALAALEGRVGSDPQLRYVEPIVVEVEQHLRLDPAPYTIDPTTGVPFE